MESEHDNGTEDRRWSYKCCAAQVNPEFQNVTGMADISVIWTDVWQVYLCKKLYFETENVYICAFNIVIMERHMIIYYS